ncbi:hypothetical protein M378DRAFT_130285 [Amanita muscaria Koide BX008]|uniref:Aminomethyltransferase n=1 Tax=Amanita muscaria (strain Koide BX008) TaxID=946122 RepID=A0A0C2SCX4_AMAMK|nr:hypothetical protein M378DRAFT_130285 [Amanita muscaria Koide BX008]
MATLIRSLSSLSRSSSKSSCLAARLGGARSLATESKSIRRTGLYDFHIENGAKMVPFAGYSMPLTYGDVGQVASHHHVRNEAGLFDVGHMVQTTFRGPTATAFLEHLTPSSLSSLPAYTSTLSVLVNPQGGIIDDTVITKHSSNAFYVVTNAGRRDEDLPWFTTQLEKWNSPEGPGGKEGPVEMEVMEDWGLIAIQGPQAASYLQSLTSYDLRELTFGKSAYVPIEGFNLHVARGGYTGEDGFEISIPPSHTVEVAKLLHKSPVQLAGLAARDSLRLEAGMCLYGNDLDESTSPVEAGLSWVIGKDRKETGGFIGADEVLRQLKEGPTRRRVGFIVEGAPARQGAKIFAPSSPEPIGTITSGIPSPTLSKNIAMGYVQSGHHKKGTQVEVEVRGKRQPAVVTPMPFIKPRYWRG